MFGIFHGRSSHYRKSFLCLFFAIVIFVCTAYEKPELDRLVYAGRNNTSSVTSLKNDVDDVITNEFTGYSVVKCISSRKSVTGKFAGSRVNSLYAVLNSLFVLAGIFVLLCISSRRPILTSHRLIIAYIHDSDGMKP